MSVCGSEFGYVYADHGQCVLIRADRSGELDRQTLIPKKEKLDSCYLTREGMVACLSIDEDTDQFHRELTLLSAREDAQRRSGEDGRSVPDAVCRRIWPCCRLQVSSAAASVGGWGRHLYVCAAPGTVKRYGRIGSQFI